MGCTRQSTCCCYWEEKKSYFKPGERGQSNMSSLYPLILKQSLQIITSFTGADSVDVEGLQDSLSLCSPPLPHSEWAVLHGVASIIHQAAENIIHIHKFPLRELWSRWYKRLYGSDRISHSGLINSWTESQMLLAAAHMLQLPLTGQEGKNNNNIKHRNDRSDVTAASVWARKSQQNNIKQQQQG